MIRHGLEEKNLYYPIDGKLQNIIEYFVKFYGEKYRDRITDRLTKTIFFFIDHVYESGQTQLDKYFFKKKSELIGQFKKDLLEKIHVAMTIEPNEMPMLFENMRIWKDEIKEEDFKQACNFFKHIKSIKVDLSSPAVLKSWLQNDDFRKEIYKMLNMLNDFYFENYKESFDYLRSERNGLEREDNEDYLIREKKADAKFLINCENHFVLNLIYKLSIPETKENIDKLVAMTPEFIDYVEIDRRFMSTSIKNKYLCLFKEIASMSKNKEISEKKEGVKIIEKIIMSEKALVKKERMEQEYQLIMARSHLADAFFEIENNLILGYDFSSAIYRYIGDKDDYRGGFNFTTVAKDDLLNTYNICVIPSYLDLDNATLIHEMNHAIMSNASMKNNKLDIRQGLISISYHLSSVGLHYQNYSDRNRFEALNEIINDYLSQKVCALLDADKYHIGYLKDKKACVYRCGFPLLAGFIEDNMDDIITSCMSNQPRKLGEFIGQKELDELADAASKYLNIFRENEHVDAINEVESFFKNNPNFSFKTIKNHPWSENAQKLVECFLRVKAVQNKVRAKKKDLSLGKEKIE